MEGYHSKAAFSGAFSGAQKILRDTFGMQMVELMSRNDRDKIGEDEKKDQGKPTGRNSGTLQNIRTLIHPYLGAKKSGTYILRSVLTPALIKAATTKDNDLHDAELQNLVDTGFAQEVDDVIDAPEGTLLSWDTVESVALTGVLQVILCLILANGRSIPESA